TASTCLAPSKASGTSGSRFLGVLPQKGFCMTAAGTVVHANLEGGKGALKAVRRGGVDGRVRGFEEIPHTGRNGWINLLKFWRENRFQQLHKHMERTFNVLGPIYREKVGTLSSVNILLPSDISELFQSEGLHPRRMTLQPWATHREIRNHNKGVFLKNGEEWRSDRLQLNKEVMLSASVRRFLPLLDEVSKDFCGMLQARVEKEGRGEEGKRSLTIDPSPDLFRFALEASCHVIYGERIGLFSSSPSLESQKFIWAVERMLTTTPPLLYLPPRLLLRIGAPLWTQHATAWDHIFSHAQARIQRAYQRLSSSQARRSATGATGGQYTGVLGQLMEKGQLSLDLIKANITELMAGGVDTTAVPLQFALFELGRNPEVQERVRQQVRTSYSQAGGDPQKALQGAPLLKATIKEVLRYSDPTKLIRQKSRYLRIILLKKLNKHVFGELGLNPSKVCSASRLSSPWSCLHPPLSVQILLNFHLSVPSSEDIKTNLTLILQPETPPRITFTKL
uniref:Cytochrome P450C11 n=1 Tax=Xiphophorus couchianus TaxID=32473 RepID=A0A3B5MRH0_9TELE